MSPAQQARRGWCLEQGHTVRKNVWWWADCPKHGRQAHLSYLGGRCERCQAEGLEKS